GGAKWGVVAPGGANDHNPNDDIVSTWPNNQYATLSGTSMAVPQVAGAVALLLSKGLDRDAAVQRLLATATPCAGCGHGRIAAAPTAVGAGPAAVARRDPPARRPPAPGGGRRRGRAPRRRGHGAGAGPQAAGARGVTQMTLPGPTF